MVNIQYLISYGCFGKFAISEKDFFVFNWTLSKRNHSTNLNQKFEKLVYDVTTLGRSYTF